MGNVKKERKQRKSILDDYIDEIKYYVNIGINTSSISRLMNNKINRNLSINSYRNFIISRLKQEKL